MTGYQSYQIQYNSFVARFCVSWHYERLVVILVYLQQLPLGFVLIDPRKCVLYISASQGYNYAAQRNEISVNVIYFISTVRLGYPSFNKYIPSRTIPGALILLSNCTNQYPTQSLSGQFYFIFCFQCIHTSNKRKWVGEGYLCYFNSICYI